MSVFDLTYGEIEILEMLCERELAKPEKDRIEGWQFIEDAKRKLHAEGELEPAF